MKTRICLMLCTILAAGVSCASYKPKAGFVPDETTAIAIAVAVWTPIYGEENIKNERPFKAVLKDGIWHVEGTLPAQYTMGGVAEADISKTNGKIMRISHGK